MSRWKVSTMVQLYVNKRSFHLMGHCRYTHTEGECWEYQVWIVWEKLILIKNRDLSIYKWKSSKFWISIWGISIKDVVLKENTPKLKILPYVDPVSPNKIDTSILPFPFLLLKCSEMLRPQRHFKIFIGQKCFLPPLASPKTK